MFADRFQWYCQKVMPLIYDQSLSYYEVLCKLTQYIKELSAAELELEQTFNLFKVRQDELELQFGDLAAQWVEYKQVLGDEWHKYQEDLNADWDDFQRYMTDHYTAFTTEVNNRFNSFIMDANKNYADFTAQVRSDLQEMADTLEDIKAGKYVDLYLDSLKNYIDDNLQEFVARIAKQVTFGLNTEGRLIAWIPDTWDFLQFGTIQEGDLYGHLTIAY